MYWLSMCETMQNTEFRYGSILCNWTFPLIHEPHPTCCRHFFYLDFYQNLLVAINIFFSSCFEHVNSQKQIVIFFIDRTKNCSYFSLNFSSKILTNNKNGFFSQFHPRINEITIWNFAKILDRIKSTYVQVRKRNILAFCWWNCAPCEKRTGKGLNREKWGSK